MDKRTVLFSQIIMTFMMASSMSGIMLLISLGPHEELLHIWPKQLVIAWPIAFILTMVLWPLSMSLTRLLIKKSAPIHQNN